MAGTRRQGPERRRFRKTARQPHGRRTEDQSALYARRRPAGHSRHGAGSAAVYPRPESDTRRPRLGYPHAPHRNRSEGREQGDPRRSRRRRDVDRLAVRRQRTGADQRGGRRRTRWRDARRLPDRSHRRRTIFRCRPRAQRRMGSARCRRCRSARLVRRRPARHAGNDGTIYRSRSTRHLPAPSL